MTAFSDASPLLREYLTYMETIMGRSHKTVSEYYLDLRTFFRFILRKRNPDLHQCEFDSISIDGVSLELVKSITKTDVLDYLLFIANERPKYHKSPATTYGNGAVTRARKLAALRSFYDYLCVKRQYDVANPLGGLTAPKTKKSLPKFLNMEESISLLNAVDGPYKERDYCILTLFLNCGLRVAELCSINLRDIGGDKLRVLGKGNKERFVYLNEACLDAIDAYLPHRIVPNAAAKEALFTSKMKNRISVQTVKWLVNKYLAHAGLAQKHCSAHKLRHTAATLMYQNGVDVRTLKEVLGHENLDTTMIYTHVIDQNLKDAAQKNPLSAFRKKSNEAENKTTEEETES